jgi:energy-coupling factor transporter ATP-binding protein EcfA2
VDNEVIISFEDFGFQYTAQAEPTLYNINLNIRKGEKVLIAGPSGCGKSTLAHCINGLVPGSYPGKTTGKLTVGGKNALELGLFGLSKIVGTVLQDSDGQFIGLTVAEDIAFALENDCIPTEEMHREVERIAQLVDVKQVLKHAPHEISGGQKQRVGLGGVMVGQVDVLLFDEPLANLDPATGKQAIVLIDEIQKRTGCAVVIIEHRLEDVLYCPVDRVVVMGDGRIQYDGDPDTLLCSHILQVSHRATHIDARQLQFNALYRLKQHGIPALGSTHESLAQRAPRRLTKIAALGVLKMRPSRNQRDPHIRDRETAQNTHVRLLLQSAKHLVLPGKIQNGAVACGRQDNSAACRQRLHIQMHLGVVAQRLVVPHALHGRADGLTVKNAALVKGDLKAKAIKNLLLQNLKLHLTHQLHLDLLQM